jgi:hypothetical protein
LRPDQGIGSGKPKPKGTGQQAPSKDLKPNVKVEDEGVLGALAKNGGGGNANSGGVLSGKGLGGKLEGSLEGLERGSDLDVKGAGGVTRVTFVNTLAAAGSTPLESGEKLVFNYRAFT